MARAQLASSMCQTGPLLENASTLFDAAVEVFVWAFIQKQDVSIIQAWMCIGKWFSQWPPAAPSYYTTKCAQNPSILVANGSVIPNGGILTCLCGDIMTSLTSIDILYLSIQPCPCICISGTNTSIYFNHATERQRHRERERNTKTMAIYGLPNSRCTSNLPCIAAASLEKLKGAQ